MLTTVLIRRGTLSRHMYFGGILFISNKFANLKKLLNFRRLNNKMVGADRRSG